MSSARRRRSVCSGLLSNAAAPDAGEAKPGTKSVADAKVGQFFNAHVMSGKTVVGGTVTSVQRTRVAAGDVCFRKTHMLSLGVERTHGGALCASIFMSVCQGRP